jgi:hypothetical protein
MSDSYTYTLILPTDTPETVTIKKRSQPFTHAEIKKMLDGHMEIIVQEHLGGGNLEPQIIVDDICEQLECSDFFAMCTEGARRTKDDTRPLNGYATRFMSLAVTGPVLICSAELIQ